MNNEHKSEESATKNITLGVVLGWLFGVIFLIAGVSTLMSSPVWGVVMILLGIFILPPLGEQLRKKSNVNISGGVKVLVVLVVLIGATVMDASDRAAKAVSAASGSASSPSVSANAPAGSSDQLELVSYSCDKEYGYFTIKGQVKNISGASMKDVQAVGSIYTNDGTFVTSSDALIEYNPILPGQTSPFTTMSTDNPAATKCMVEFKEFFGGTIPTKVDK